MKFEVLTKRQRIERVPALWRRQYEDRKGWTEGRFKAVHDKLLQLDLKTCSEQDIEQIIGNYSWTEIRCDSCRKEVEKIVFMRCQAQNEYGEDSICVDCITGALSALSGESK